MFNKNLTFSNQAYFQVSIILLAGYIYNLFNGY